METGLQLGLEECVGFGQPEGGSMDFSGQDPVALDGIPPALSFYPMPVGCHLQS